MSKENDNVQNENQDVVDENLEQEDAQQEEVITPEQALMESAKIIDELQKTLEAQKDQHLRLRAEFDNYRKRTAQDNEKSKIRGIAQAIEAFFPAMDGIDRAIKACKDDSILKGMLLVRKQFDQALQTLGVTEIDPQDEEFNPEYHNAVMNEVNPEKVGIVIEVFQKGYRYKDTLLRPAMVKVGIDE